MTCKAGFYTPRFPLADTADFRPKNSKKTKKEKKKLKKTFHVNNYCYLCKSKPELLS